ncbi:MAG: MBL fold metallo-hydrolase [Proteobacteria bacterium]|nr:MBL fold metallo-hydrolase [Pseudomonadota bacterium]
MKVQFVGCGDAFGSGGRFNTCFHVAGENANFLIDCGATSLVALKRWGIERESIDAILITHFHADHFGGIPFFVLEAQFAKRTRPLVIAGPPGIEARFAQVMEAAFEHSSKTSRRFELALVTLGPERETAIGPIKVTPFPVVHGASGGPFFAYRVEAEGRVIAYSGDTEWTDNLIEVARNADLFIVEAYYRERKIRNHLDLRTLETYLPEIKPRKLILTHMSDDVLAHHHTLPHTTAEDGLIVTL